MKKIFLLIVILTSLGVCAQTIHHKLSMPEPQTHYFHVEMELKDFTEEEIVVSIPVWTPGSYLVREFSKNINLVRAIDEKGKTLPIEKTKKNKWKISKGKSKVVNVKYEVYAFELSVRTSFLDLTHGYVNGTNVFMYPENYKSKGGKLTIIPHASFKKITTALPRSSEGVANDSGTTFIFDDYDHLADSPIEIGNQEVFSFDAAGVKHHVAMYGPGNYNIERLKSDMARIIEAATAVFGQNPNKEYWFIIHNTSTGGGGLEHKVSTTLNVNRWTYDDEGYKGFLSLVAHEYFHLWNVKRIRPKELGPFDYDNENYTDLLWVMEGFTSYYDELLLRRAGFHTQDEYLKTLKSTMNYVESSPGNKVQPVAHSSFDAWIKAYRPNENSGNVTISYYSKGQLIAAVFDAMIIKSSKGKKSLDDFMRLLYSKYYEELDRGFTAEEFQNSLEKFIGTDLDEFFRDHIYGTKTVDYATYFKELGLTIELSENQGIAFGVSTTEKDGRLVVRSVTANSMAEKVGLSPNDEIIAFNGFRVDSGTFNRYMSTLNPGDSFNLIISRDEQLMSLDSKMGTVELARYSFSFDENNSLGQYWLREMK
ncbi:MAG: PDZ domain-containing protein [Brumimicrobium sp.]|nr:PDZ domain-containing protein [Brumimicrobium sp.]